MFADMKKEMAKQETLFDWERKRMTLDQENADIEREELKRLNDQLLSHITTLQNTQGSPLLSDGPTDA